MSANDAIIVHLVGQVDRLEKEVAGHKLVMQDYAQRIDNLESKIRDIIRSIYNEERT